MEGIEIDLGRRAGVGERIEDETTRR